jgi:hypothetical protein
MTDMDDAVLRTIREFSRAGGAWRWRLTARGIAQALSTPQERVATSAVLSSLRRLQRQGQVVEMRRRSTRAALLWREADFGDAGTADGKWEFLQW